VLSRRELVEKAEACVHQMREKGMKLPADAYALMAR
jgi:pentatricopeptide repeat protein